ncbi:peptidoglycan DD-metalloendopeptidase family protein [Candidatus Parcubacteria bacterium]|nr:peptidoglycan DD-metalloendopeptidase family protein [Candidatus Parcubacteria bacterium]
MKKFTCASLSLVLIAAAFFVARNARAATVDELQQKIAERNSTIAQLEKEIAQYQDQIKQTGLAQKTLQNTLKQLKITQDKLKAELAVTGDKIESTNDTIESLTQDISDKEQKIVRNLDAIRSGLQEIDQTDANSMLENLLTGTSLSDVWNDVETETRFQVMVKNSLDETKTLKKDLEVKKSSVQLQKKQLVNLRSDLSDKKQVIEISQKTQADLLSATKNKESEYKKILADKQAKRAAFEKELLEYESQLHFAIDPKSLPAIGSGVLKWPLDSITITQYFGNTDFAKSTAAYGGKGHNGVDFAAAIGTRILAAADGIVEGTGNTDLVCPGASYGKWVFIRHNNGLSTLYGHLSLIKVTPGQSVHVGDIIGYSGNTGFTTGPHLHFTVYATQGVRITQQKSQVCGGIYTMPVADLKGYLNPLLYL